MPNRLAAEHSPYLLQHLDNPVDWYPWGEEAFARARAEDKPIFLSVGYSTCHWCHVMAHESFEDPAVADALNRDFVSVKVDREERPDVDRVYMTFVQSTTGGGGWPMSVWLTPALEPFYGGTYFPPVSRWNRPGFVDILAEIARVWRDERDKVLNSAHAIVERLQMLTTRAAARADVPGPGVLDRAVQEFAVAYDEPRGGFGAAPKFPRPSELLFLLREHARTGAGRPLEMALGTLQAIARGGMRDHLGGGFHRYSVDADWRVPHFEKMLYDQAQLTWAFAEAAQAARDPRYLEVALDTLDYVRRDLRDPGGGFYSAEDADSVPFEQVGEDHPRSSEGAFYIWRDDEIQEALGEDAGLARLRYGVSPTGNAPFDPHGEFTGRNLLYLARGVDQIARDVSRPVEEVQRALDRVRATLVARRRMRPRPHLDDKVITAWNGLAMGAFARVSRVLASDVLPDDQDRQQMYLLEARRAAAFAREHLWDEATATLKRRFRVGHSGVAGYAEDYACLVFGLLELFQADGDPAWLTWAIELQRRQDELFWDSEHGGWFSTTAADRSVVLRLKDDHDGAEPAASSMAVQNLLVLSHLTRPDASRVEQIERTLGTFAGRAGSGRAMPMMLAALSSYHAGVTQLVIVGEPDERATRSLMRTAAEAYHPATLVVPVCVRHRESLERLLPWIATMEAPRGSAVAYLCRGLTCLAPATSPDELRRQLSGSGAPS